MADVRFPVEAGHIMLFARAIGDPNPIYSDENYAKGTDVGSIIAPPTFERASSQFDPSYPLRPRVSEPWFGSGRDPSGKPPADAGGDGGTGLHAEQRYEYHQPLRPGDVLTAKTRPGKTWEREGRRAGKMTFAESITEYFNEAGELVVTATGVSVRTERPVDQG